MDSWLIICVTSSSHRTRSASRPGTSWSSRCSDRSPGPVWTVPPSGVCPRRRNPRTDPDSWRRAGTGPGGTAGTARSSKCPVEVEQTRRTDTCVDPLRSWSEPVPGSCSGSAGSRRVRSPCGSELQPCWVCQPEVWHTHTTPSLSLSVSLPLSLSGVLRCVSHVTSPVKSENKTYN